MWWIAYFSFVLVRISSSSSICFEVVIEKGRTVKGVSVKRKGKRVRSAITSWQVRASNDAQNQRIELSTKTRRQEKEGHTTKDYISMVN